MIFFLNEKIYLSPKISLNMFLYSYEHALLFIYFFLNFTRIQLFYTVVSISVVQHSDPVTHIHAYIFLILSFIMFYPKRLDIIPCAVQKDLIAYPF